MVQANSNCFRAWREGMGLTQTRAAYLLGCDVRTVQRYDTGSFPTSAILQVMWDLARGIRLKEWPVHSSQLPEVYLRLRPPRRRLMVMDLVMSTCCRRQIVTELLSTKNRLRPRAVTGNSS
jgi:hypothetical protein